MAVGTQDQEIVDLGMQTSTNCFSSWIEWIQIWIGSKGVMLFLIIFSCMLQSNMPEIVIPKWLHSGYTVGTTVFMYRYVHCVEKSGVYEQEYKVLTYGQMIHFSTETYQGHQLIVQNFRDFISLMRDDLLNGTFSLVLLIFPLLPP